MQSIQFARILGVEFDSTLSCRDHISAVCNSGNHCLCNIEAVRKYLPRESLLGLIHAFVTSKVDFYNSLRYGLPNAQLSGLQKHQNQAARIATGTARFEHITPTLDSLHWSPVKWRIEYEILLFAHKYIYGSSPDYLDRHLRQQYRATRSASVPTSQKPTSKHIRTGDSALSVCAPMLWNSLPTELLSDFKIFKCSLKTHFYQLGYCH